MSLTAQGKTYIPGVMSLTAQGKIYIPVDMSLTAQVLPCAVRDISTGI
jgi:hypothetical protein